MENYNYPIRPKILMAIYYLLDAMPFGFLVAGLIFDIIYFKTAEMLWSKSAAWCIAIGLVIAIIPRLINLYFVWSTGGHARNKVSLIGFWFYGFGILAAILNSFVHSRDAYATASSGVLLSILTVVLVAIAYIAKAFENNHKL
ncbi:hypothetical protein [Acinetobacter shaoyimingii]|uniref:DUF2231 domain-containing protein n=1 Tax=Acinetobacter shaoyimingii TaxID=2715164 RepID=A0A6G8RSL5_9GAMM|nr:hypothetical protein [Acinetobacter shaoyimingii]QIO04916.1 hypothetical protein G8E00_02495 [Acinetobacter shaoyimingii]